MSLRAWPVVAAGLRAMRRNLAPAMVLWAVAMAVVLVYALLPGARPAFARVAQWKLAGGYAFSAAASALAGGIAPFVALIALRRLPRRRLATAVFLIGFWIYRGVEVDAFYRLQAWLFGGGTDAATVAKKVALDMFVYSAFWTGPTSLIAYRWKDCGFSPTRVRAAIDRSFWRLEVPTVVVSIWGTWMPAVAIIYCLPSALQVPLFSIVLCFWVLVIEIVAARPGDAVPAPVDARDDRVAVAG